MKPKLAFAIVCFIAGTAFVFSQTPKETTATAIPGVIAAGAKVQLIWQGFEGADGIINDAEGNLLFAERKANRVSKIDKNDKLTPLLTDTNEAGALAIDSKGQIVDIERKDPQRVRILAPTRKVLADSCDGKKLEGMRDLTVAKGKYLGTIPTPRPDTSLAFAGRNKKMLYIVGRGADGPGDQDQARSIYRVPMIAQGFKGRAK